VISDDGGVNYAAVGGDMGGSFLGLRPGPAALSAFAPGSKGQVAFTIDGGVTWKVVSVPTSSDIVDTSWTSSMTGYALDARGGLFRTANGGASWQTLSAGAGPPANSVVALADNSTVLLVGPTGVKRAVSGGPFTSVSGRPVATAALSAAQIAGPAIVAWGVGSRNLVVSTDKGASWRAIKLPDGRRLRIKQASFLSRSTGYVLDTGGRLWLTSDAGRKWRELVSTGAAATGIAFGSATSGFVTAGSFAGDATDAYVLHTSDAGKTWVPQPISGGALIGLAAPDALHGYALLAPVPGQQPQRQFFFTASGGAAGTRSILTLKAAPTKLTSRSLRKAHGMVTISGTLSGALGGEQVAVSARPIKGGRWTTQVMTAGVNGGSFSARFRVSGITAFVAQWAGDSGRAGAASQALVVRVR
jgi:photosystem II stability/assembly factor-like uncharacterized protein